MAESTKVGGNGSVATLPDLAPRLGSALEWWFFQGRVEGKALGRREFMLSLFRQRGKGNAADGHMLLASTLEPDSGRQRVTSRVSGQLIDNFLAETPYEAEALGFDAHVVDAFLQEVAVGGPPAPISREDREVDVGTGPFSIRWNGVRIAETGPNLELCFALPEEDADCVLFARPAAPWLTGLDLEHNIATMAYDCCPRLDVSGTADGEEVTGQLWFDHQWGDYGWLRGENPGDGLLGWIWLGINLDDGCDVMIERRYRVEGGGTVSSFCVLFEDGAAPRLVHDLALTATRHWQSPASLAEYPVSFDIGVPEFDLELAFEPAVDNQEIPVFGLMGAIWQGVGQVAGRHRGREVGGRARLELQGLGYVPDYRAYTRRWARLVDGHLKAFLPRPLDQDKLAQWAGAPRWGYDAHAQSEMLSEPVWDLLKRGGKHWRPIFGLLLLDALGADRARYEALMSIAPELIHNGSVIIDDIEDASLTRRGEDSVHRRFGLATAINAANTLYFLPQLEIVRHEGLDTAQREEIFAVLARMFTQGHLGQAQDLYWSKMAAPERVKIIGAEETGKLILQTHAFKAASAVRAISDIACIIARAEQNVREKSARLAGSWGTAFQMVDDVNNFAKAPDWGKVRGEDVHEGKVTYPIHLAMRRLEGARRARLAAILGNDQLRQSAEGLEEAIALVEASSALGQCRKEARSLMEADWPAFSAALPQTHAKLMLRALLTSLLDLRFEM